MSEQIKISCTGTSSLELDELIQFQGDLKRLSSENLNKLKNSIIKRSFCSPIFIWENDGIYNIVDGTQRRTALMSLRNDGYHIPPLPVVFIQAENEKEARDKLLAVSSQYGNFDQEELESWLAELDDDVSETLRLVDTEIEIDEYEENNIPNDFNEYDENIETEYCCPKCKYRWSGKPNE